MIRTGTFRKKHKREWTCYAVAIPGKAMIVASILEYNYTHAEPSVIAVIAGSFLVIVGIVIRVRGHMELNGAFSPYVGKSAEQELVQSGMYRNIRHPMYIGSILLYIGMPLILLPTWAWCFSAIGMVGILLRIRKEEAFLIEELVGYKEYTERTWRLLPFVY